MKPLFIPLKAEHFNAFADGTKHHEIRLYNLKWNADTCHAGRHVLLSYGYGKRHRLTGIIAGFEIRHGNELTNNEQAAIETIYPNALTSRIIRIHITNLKPQDQP